MRSICDKFVVDEKLTDSNDISLSCLLSLRPITEDIFLSDVTEL